MALYFIYYYNVKIINGHFNKYLKNNEIKFNLVDTRLYSIFQKLYKYEKYAKNNYYESIINIVEFFNTYNIIKRKRKRASLNTYILQLKQYKYFASQNIESIFFSLPISKFKKIDHDIKKINIILDFYINSILDEFETNLYPQENNIIL